MLVQKDSNLEFLLISGLINNNASILIEDYQQHNSTQSSWKSVGNPTDAAILALFNKSGLDKNEINRLYTTVREYPFNSSVKRMSKIVQSSIDAITIFSVKVQQKFF